ncbi:ATP-binding protein [Clostridium beijerinckii]|uniref:Uncharacterized protein n=1 Tax=Clostridium beijerinckii TaxID=1520 RepID=A0AAE5LR83_CLOBE|nr:ATP-binding protein [Clostridium beijerinckii]NSB15663.1 hypothetical protein [Clostridium beijerinckii]OOM33525.1 hypothetical protein CLOBE_05530 [Clostridium beijerinckii]
MCIFKPKVKEVAMFKEIALNIKNPNEIIREAISNSYDADSLNIWIKVRRSNSIDYELIFKDDGKGMKINEVHSFFNLGDSKKIVQNIGEKGLGTKTYFKSKKIKIKTKAFNDKGYIVTMDNPWEKLINDEIPTYAVEEDESIDIGTEITITGYIIDNPEKYFNFDSIKDYILWFTAGGNFKNIFANNLTLQKLVKDINKTPKIHIIDQILNKQTQMAGVHQFAPPNENPKIDLANKKYKYSVNYCRHFGPFNRETTINGNLVTIQLYGTVSGVNCRRRVCKLRQSETHKARFGLYLCKDFIPFERANFLLGDEQYYHYHLLANSQNFELTADRNSISNEESITVKWIYSQIEDIFKNYIKPIAEKGYFKLRKEEEESYEVECRIEGMNKYIKKIDLVDNLYAYDLPIKKIPQCEYEVALLFTAILSNENTKNLIKDINEIISYSSRMTTDIICEDYNDGICLLEIEYKLSNIFKHKHPLDTYDYVVCWKIDIEKNIINEVNSIKAILVSEGKDSYIVTGNNKKIKVIELKKLLNEKYREK